MTDCPYDTNGDYNCGQSICPICSPENFTSMKTSNDYAKEIAAWSDRNWSRELHHPDFGIVEEIGEVSHCILKHIQGIRGFDSETFFMSQLEDAFADVAVYLHHYLAKNEATISFLPSSTSTTIVGMNDRAFMAYCLRSAIVLLDYTDRAESVDRGIFSVSCQRLWNGLFYWAAKYNINLVNALDKTWTKVQQRDWKNRPTDAASHENIGTVATP